ncbi:MAG: glucosamine--fructose-6-phosphate aminotransferase [Gammaproteobacteria bacterium]|nr:glucosamine--fructose-6-phosphate aminotransferase [Gammaproteobacteria bacterium]
MTKLPKSLKSWGSENFKKVLKQELEALDNGTLPLDQATCQGGKADGSKISALINSTTENEISIMINVGVFFDEIIAGCNCGDDPMSENTYCDLLVTIDKRTSEGHFSIKTLS